MNGRFLTFLLFLALLLYGLATPSASAQEPINHLVQIGDSWDALALRYNIPKADLQQGRINPHRQPIIGSTLTLPVAGNGRLGALVRVEGTVWPTAVTHNQPIHTISYASGLRHASQPALYRPLWLAGGNNPPSDLPIGFTQLELSQTPARPGQPLAWRGRSEQATSSTAKLDTASFDAFQQESYHVGLIGTGAFYGSGAPTWSVQVGERPLWQQPLRFADEDLWDYQQITLTGSAAQIDQQSIADERARLFAIWSEATSTPQWDGAFQLPITNFLDYSSAYGARRSYNGGPYRSYHEGVDFSAYGGTAVIAPARGTVVIAEELYVRGGAVIIDHGLGVYSGYYHLSSVDVSVGQVVEQGEQVGAVGTTGLSTGNHLHWDFIVADTWVDALAWVNGGLGCWILEGLGQACGG